MQRPSEIRKDARKQYPNNYCAYTSKYSRDIWQKEWNKKHKEAMQENEQEAEQEANKIIWIDPREQLIDSIDQIQDILKEMKGEI